MKIRKRILRAGAVFLAIILVGGVWFLTDLLVRQGSTGLLQNSVNDISNGAESAVSEAISSLDAIYFHKNISENIHALEALKNRFTHSDALSDDAHEEHNEHNEHNEHDDLDHEHHDLANVATLCSPEFMLDVSRHMQHAVYVRQVLVENSNGAQFCSSPDAHNDYIQVSEKLPIPGSDATISAIGMEGADYLLLKVTLQIDHTQSISALVPISQALASGNIPAELANANYGRVSFTDGTSLWTLNNSEEQGEPTFDSSYITASTILGNLPLRIDAAMKFAKVRERRKSFYIVSGIVGMLLASTYLFLAFRVIKNLKNNEFDLEHAISSGEIQPYYQPVIDLSTGQVSGCEMLARWVKPDGEIISPGVFIEYAEVTGMAVPMTLSLLEQVRVDLEVISTRLPGLKIAINLFAGHFNDMAIVHDTKKIFENSSISMNQLVFEITERHPLGDSNNASAVIAGLHDLGCKLALDDVGTGHSNLAHVQSLGVDIIKIDQIFVSAITPETTSLPILDGLIRMALDLGSGIVAEGVETTEQAAYLSKRGVKDVQGFLFSPAIPAEKYIQMLGQVNKVDNGSARDKDVDNEVDDLFAA